MEAYFFYIFTIIVRKNIKIILWLVALFYVANFVYASSVPDPPTGVSAVSGNRQAVVTFSAPGNDGGSAITSYTVTSDPEGLTASGASSPITVTGLTNNTSYTFTVVATNVIGDSSASSASSAVTPTAEVLGVSTPQVAYGLRTLDSLYTGPLVRIRRDDDETADVYADDYDQLSLSSSITVISGSSEATTLGDFVSGVGGYVSIWYDQAQRNNLEQTTTSSQPQLVSSGAVITGGTNSWPTVRFDGSSQFLVTTSTESFSQQYNFYTVSVGRTQTAANPRMLEFGAGGSRALYQIGAGTGMYAGSFLTSSSQTAPYSTMVQMSFVYNGASSARYKDGTVSGSGNAGTQSISGVGYVGSGNSGSYFNGDISEFIVFGTNVTAPDRQTVEGNQIAHFITAATAPDPPTSISATAGNASAPVSFTAPGDDGGKQITLYTATSNPGGFTATSTASPITVLGLTNDTAYTFTVTATNVAGTSSASSASNEITPQAVDVLGVSEAVMAYGLRTLNDSYVDPLVRIRRTDGGIADVYADNDDQLSLSSSITVISGGSAATNLGDFVDGVDAYVSIWYDQANRDDLVQTNTANQPKLVSSGALLTAGAADRPTLSFDGSNQKLQTSLNEVIAQPFEVFITSLGGTQTSSFPRIFEIGASGSRALYQVGGGYGMYAGSFLSATAQTSPYGFNQMTMLFNGASSERYKNGTLSGSGNAGSESIDGFGNIGGGSSLEFTGNISEFIVYDVALSDADRQTVENNQLDQFLYTVPDAPTGISALAGDTEATVSFTAPGDNGGKTITSYTVTSDPGSITASSTASPITVTGLTNGTNYTFTVVATNSVGNSASSTTSNTVTSVDDILSVTGPLLAYGLRTLKPSYSDPLIRIRRTDDGVADIYADDNDELSLTSSATVVSGGSGATNLGDFVAGTDAYVSIWYDQAGRNNLEQTTTSSQPQIIDGGSLLTDGVNDKATIQFDGSTQKLVTTSSEAFSQPFDVFVVSSGGIQTGSFPRLFEFGVDVSRALYQIGSGTGMYAGSFLTAASQTSPYLFNQLSMEFDTTSSALYRNGTSAGSGNTGSYTVSGDGYVGSGLGATHFNGNISEFIIYNTKLSTSDRQSIETSQADAFINEPTAPEVTTELVITTPGSSVDSASSVATISYLDQKGATVSIPYIQTSSTFTAITNNATDVMPAGGGVKFVLNEGESDEQVTYDMTSSSYTATFSDLAKGEYTLDVYVVDSSQQVLSGDVYHDMSTNIGIGNIYVAVGDSITKGAGGVSGTDCVDSGNITNWTESKAGTVSTDNRNFCQWSSQDPQYFKGWMPELNNELSAYLGYPIFILNEGYGGYTAYGYISNPMGTAAWQNRIDSLSPNKWLILLGTNDAQASRTATQFVDAITAIVDSLKSDYDATVDSITVGVVPYTLSAAVQARIDAYLTPLDTYITDNSLQQGPDFSNYFEQNSSYIAGDNFHPDEDGILQMARLWSLSMIRPKNFTAASSAGTVTFSWDDLGVYDALPTGSSNINGYELSYGISSAVYTETNDVGDVLTTSLNSNDLTTGTEYFFTLRSYGVPAANDYSLYATEQSLTYATVSDPPTVGTITSGNAHATIYFTPPEDNGGAEITSYTVTSNPDAISASGTTSPISITGLTDGTTYTFTMTATNSAGTSVASTASDEVTPQNTVTSGSTIIVNEMETETTSTTKYILTYGAGAHGSIIGMATQEVVAGADGNAVTAVPDTGYHFAHWSDTSVQNHRKDTAVNANVSVIANFAINQYTVIFQDFDGINIDSQTVEHGVDASQPASPIRQGYVFTGWSVSTTNVTSDLTAVAEYESNTKLEYILPLPNLSAIPLTGGGTPSTPSAGEGATPSAGSPVSETPSPGELKTGMAGVVGTNNDVVLGLEVAKSFVHGSGRPGDVSTISDQYLQWWKRGISIQYLFTSHVWIGVVRIFLGW